MTMNTDEQKIYDKIISDAADPSIGRNDVLHRMTKLSFVINGDERQALNESVYRALDGRTKGGG